MFVSLVTIFNFKFNRQDSSPNCHSKSRHVGKHSRARFKPNLEPLACFRRAYGAHWKPKLVENSLVWISSIVLMDTKGGFEPIKTERWCTMF